VFRSDRVYESETYGLILIGQSANFTKEKLSRFMKNQPVTGDFIKRN